MERLDQCRATIGFSHNRRSILLHLRQLAGLRCMQRGFSHISFAFFGDDAIHCVIDTSKNPTKN